MAVFPRSFRWVLLALSTFAADAASAGEPAVEILGPVRIPVTTPAKLPSFCHAAPNHRLFGCTTFAGQSLTCSCQADGDTWRMVITARFVPILYFTDSHTAEFHERLHVRDVADRFEAWIAALAAERFDTESTCQARVAVVSAEASVRRHLEMFARQSNSWMQCTRVGERIPPQEAVLHDKPAATEVEVAEGQQ